MSRFGTGVGARSRWSAIVAALTLLVLASFAAAAPPGEPPGQAKKEAAPAADAPAPRAAERRSTRAERRGAARRQTSKDAAAPGRATAGPGRSKGRSQARGRARTRSQQPAAAPGRTRAAARGAATRGAGTRVTPGAGPRGLARRRAALARRRAARRRAVAQRSAPARPRAFVTAPAAVSAPASAPARPRSEPPAPSLPELRDEPSVVTRTLETIREVVPDWVWLALAALTLVAAAAATALGLVGSRARRLRRQRARLVEQVGVLQAALLPDVPAEVGGLAVSVAYRPAEGLAAGGDFYDVFPLSDDRVGIVVGDISGHGREALAPATSLRHLVRAYIEAGLTPRGAVQLAGLVVEEQGRDELATVIAAIHDPRAATISWATAGHPPPVVIGPAAHQPVTVSSPPPLGCGAVTGTRQTTLALQPGSTVCIYTDGLIDARMRDGSLLGMDRLRSELEALGPGATAEALVERVARRSKSFGDDVAVCLIHPLEGAASELRVEEIEVGHDTVRSPRLRRFLAACGLGAEQVDEAIRDAAAAVLRHGTIVIRVRLAGERSGVDVLGGADAGPGADVAALVDRR